MILVGVASYYATRSLHGLSVFSGVNLALGVLLLVIGAGAQLRAFRGFSGAASRRVALRALALFAAGFAAVIALDLAARRSTARLDLTVDRLYTLSDQSRALCGELAAQTGAPIELVFFEDALLAKDVRLLVDAYAEACPQVAMRDASRKEPPPGARELYTTTATTVIACRGDVCDPVGYPSERNITAAILRLASARMPRVYFLVGHGEVDLASQNDGGYSGLAALLRDQGFDVQALVGPATAELPRDAEVLIAAAPERDLLPEELALLDRYLEGGGRLLALSEPGLRSNFYSEFLRRWGFDLEDGVIVDDAASPLLQDPSPLNLLVHLFAPYNPVTRTLSRRTMLLDAVHAPGRARAQAGTRRPARARGVRERARVRRSRHRRRRSPAAGWSVPRRRPRASRRSPRRAASRAAKSSPAPTLPRARRGSSWSAIATSHRTGCSTRCTTAISC